MTAALAPSLLESLLDVGAGCPPRDGAPARREPAATDTEDRADVSATLGGDGGAFGRLVARHQQTIARQMHRFTRDRTLLEELVQDVFVEAYSSLAGFRAEAPFLHWLRRVAVRVGYRHWRQREAGARHRDLADAATLEAPSGDADAREAADYVHAWLARLPARDRLVLTLLSLEQRSVAEIAELTGWSRSLVKVAAFRARRRLRKLMEADAR